MSTPEIHKPSRRERAQQSVASPFGAPITGGPMLGLSSQIVAQVRQEGSTLAGGNSGQVAPAVAAAVPTEHLENSPFHRGMLSFINGLIIESQAERGLKAVQADQATTADQLQNAHKNTTDLKTRMVAERLKAKEIMAQALVAQGMDPTDAKREIDNIANAIEVEHGKVPDTASITDHYNRLLAKSEQAAKDYANNYQLTEADRKAADAARKIAEENLKAEAFKANLIASHGPFKSGVDMLMAMFDRAGGPGPQELIAKDDLRQKLIDGGHAFIGRAQEKGLLRLSPQQAQEVGAAIGIMQARIGTDTTARGLVNIAINGITHTVPDTVYAALNGLGSVDLLSRDKDGNLQFSGMDKFTESLKLAGVNFSGDVQNILGKAHVAIGVEERKRRTSEMWHGILGTRDDPKLMEATLTAEDLKTLPPSLIARVVAQEKARQGKPNFSPEDISLAHLAYSLPPEVRKLATMNTGAMAQANAQNGQEPYTMSFHDVSMWGILGGQPAPGMMKYARQDVGQNPEQRYAYRERPGAKTTSIFGPITGYQSLRDGEYQHVTYPNAGPAGFRAVPRPHFDDGYGNGRS